jgi:hypothetical protein
MTEASMIIEQDVIAYMKQHKLDRKTRKWAVLDQRDFLINILYYQFDWSETALGILIGKDHSTINHCKNKAFHLWEDERFIVNTFRVRHAFPQWVPPDPKEKEGKTTRKRIVSMHLDKTEYEKLMKLKKKLGVRNLGTAAHNFIFNNIDQVI